jgi:hypothetical protein
VALAEFFSLVTKQRESTFCLHSYGADFLMQVGKYAFPIFCFASPGLELSAAFDP